MREFHIPATPRSTNKTIRFPNDLIERVEAIARTEHSTFSAIVIEAVRFTLDYVDQQEKEKK